MAVSCVPCVTTGRLELHWSTELLETSYIGMLNPVAYMYVHLYQQEKVTAQR